MNDLEKTALALPLRTSEAWWEFGNALRTVDRFAVSPTGEYILADKGGSDVILARLRPVAKSLMLAALGERWDDFWRTYHRSKAARLVKARATFPGTMQANWGVLLKLNDANLMWVRVPNDWPDSEGIAWACASAGMGEGYLTSED